MAQTGKNTETKKKTTPARKTDSTPKKQEKLNTVTRDEKSAAKSEKAAANRSKPAAEGPSSQKMIHQFMPYVLTVAMIFLSACFIFTGWEGAMGSVGTTLRNFFCGLFGFTAFFTPLILLNLAIYWRKYVDMHMVGWKLTLSFVTLIFVAALFHVASASKIYPDGATWKAYGESIFGSGDALSNWAAGMSRPPVGGGFFGGLTGGFFYCTTGPVGSFILLIAIIIVCIMFLFSITPAYVMSSLRCRIANAKTKKMEKKEAIRAEEDRLRREAGQAREKEEKLRREADEARGREERKRAAAGLAAQKKQKNTAPDTAAADDEKEVPYITGVIENIRPGNSQSAAVNIAAAAVTGIQTAQEPTLIPDVSPAARDSRRDLLIENLRTPSGPEESTGNTEEAGDNGTDGETGQPASDAEKESVTILDEVLQGLSAAPKPDSEYVNGSAGSARRTPARKPAEPKKAAAPEAPVPDVISAMAPAAKVAEPEAEIPDSSISDAEKVSEDSLRTYFFPPIELLHEVKNPSHEDIEEELRSNATKIMDKLAAFNVGIRKIEYSRGPTITRYELYPEASTRVRSIAALSDDIALELAATIRMEAPIPNKNAVGVEVPNQVRALVSIRELLDSDKFRSMTSKLSSALGKNVAGEPVFFDIGKMPHLLIAGTTGSGKSVCINTIIMSLLYKARPEEVQFIMIDPKKIEMSMYHNLPHLKVPVVTDMKRAAGTLNAAVNEMEHRYQMFEECNARDLDGYNKLMSEEDPSFVPVPRIVIIIDELADLMMSAPQEIEGSIIRIAQKARAAGIHLIIGTQRPSANVITGLIKANVPSRIAFSVVSNVDSRIIIDIAGAEKLIGKGDMLFAPIGSPKPSRIQGCFVDDDEVRAVTTFIKQNSSPVRYDDEFISDIDRETDRLEEQSNRGKNDEDGEPAEFVQEADPLFNQALHVAVESGTVATSSLQRRLSIGFGRAAKIIDRMEALSFCSPANGTKPRNVILTKQQLQEMEASGDCRAHGKFI